MPRIELTIDGEKVPVADALATRLDVAVQRYNEDNKTALTLAEWLDLHLRELGVQQELLARVEALRKQTDDDLHAAIAAERDRLLNEVKAAPGGDA